MFITSNKNILGEGYVRSNSQPGIRNHVIAFSTIALTDVVTQHAAAKVPGTLTLTPQFERGLRGVDFEVQINAIHSVLTHPNVGAALVITHDRSAALELKKVVATIDKPIYVLALMDAEGLENAINMMATRLNELHEKATQCQRVPITLADLTVALECGGSDASSAVAANPAIGHFVDRLINAGGTAIVSETAEFLGAEDFVRKQSKSVEIANEILACISHEEQLMIETGEDYRGVNPTRENIEAGLTTLTEKTMGAVCKIGQSQFSGCLKFGERPNHEGLFFMDTPFFSPTSLSGMILGGAQVTLFAMGVFNPSGMPLAPTIKICGNPQTLERWGKSIDLDVSGLINGNLSLEESKDYIEEKIVNLLNGSLSCTEILGEGQLILPRVSAAL